jgi:very-short-patch-repair endonuclease
LWWEQLVSIIMTNPLIERARKLRREKTVPERWLWRALRDLKTTGRHFRQQVPIGSFIVHFADMSAGLVIELDGDSRCSENAQTYDAQRTAWLKGEGYRVLRFGNRDVLQNREGVMLVVYEALGLETMCTTTSCTLPLVGRAGVGVLDANESSEHSELANTLRRSP